MKYKLKTKILLVLSITFLLIISVGVVGWYYLNTLASDTRAILKDNYESLDYSHLMLNSVDRINRIHTKYFFTENNIFNNDEFNAAAKEFEKSLHKEINNITEDGEKELASELEITYNDYKQEFLNATEKKNTDKEIYFTKLVVNLEKIKSNINSIYLLNKKAIEKKNHRATNTAQNVKDYIIIGSIIEFFLMLFYIFRIPVFILKPIYQLKDSFRKLTQKNYSERIKLKSNDEFGELYDTFNIMVEKLEEYEKSNIEVLLSEKRKIETIVDNINDPIVGFDSDKRVVILNKEFERILSVNRNDILDKYAPDIATYNDLMRNILQSFFLKEQKASENLVKIYFENAERFYTKEFIAFNNEKSNSGYLIILKDITKYLEQDSQKTNFIATISHELKSPITSIQMSLKLLHDKRIGEINGEQEKLVENIRKETNRLLNLSSNLIDVTKAETGNIKLESQSINPSDLLYYAFETMIFQATVKKIELVISADEKLNRISIDVQKTLWVLINLISNAIRFSPEKSQIILKAEDADDAIQFTVKDFGPGIDEKYSTKIFDKFFQVPGASKHGTGLGLSIAKEFIAAQGGKIWVESKLNYGCEFKFLIPKEKTKVIL